MFTWLREPCRHRCSWCANGTARGRNGESHPARDRRDRSQPAGIPQRVDADLIADSVADRRFIMMLLAITGCLALVMSAAGVYGVISYTTSRRTQEIGIRMAVGATPRNVFALIFRQGFLTVAIGLAVGMGSALACVRSLRSVVARAGVGSPCRSLDRGRPGNRHRRNRVLDSGAACHEDGPDFRAAAGVTLRASSPPSAYSNRSGSSRAIMFHRGWILEPAAVSVAHLIARP